LDAGQAKITGLATLSPRRLEVLIDLVPIDDIEESIDIVRAAILVF
jgi:hypothetical protein